MSPMARVPCRIVIASAITQGGREGSPERRTWIVTKVNIVQREQACPKPADA
jgi:hypothetical protein